MVNLKLSTGSLRTFFKGFRSFVKMPCKGATGLCKTVGCLLQGLMYSGSCWLGSILGEFASGHKRHVELKVWACLSKTFRVVASVGV